MVNPSATSNEGPVNQDPPDAAKRSSIFELANHASLEWARHDSLEQLRHRAEFETLGTLGQGAFGVTFKAKNRVDGKIYALKRVYLGTSVEDDARKVLREVEVLSSLNSENVVRYFAAWIEKGSDLGSTTQDGGSLGSSWSFSFSTNVTGDQDDTNNSTQKQDPVCNLCQFTYKDWEVGFEQWGLLDAVLQPKFLCTSCYKDSLPSDVDVSTIRIREAKPLYLFILCEYCETTLQEAVDAIHTEFKDTLNINDAKVPANNSQRPTSEKDVLLWRYFAQCVQGLEHCHSQNFIHRDIKTSNIFVHKGVAKLGDLGLATHNRNVKDSISLHVARSSDTDDDKNTLHQESQRSQQEPVVQGYPSPTDPLAPETSLSSQVGTFLYAAPEVSGGNSYNEKCDIFSLGVVMVEMWSQFSTGMERADVLQRLHTGQLPPQWSTENPVVAKLVRDMVAREPASRPSCAQILARLIEEEVWDQKNPQLLELLVTDLQSSCQKLRQSLERKEETIHNLRELLEANNISHQHIL